MFGLLNVLLNKKAAQGKRRGKKEMDGEVMQDLSPGWELKHQLTLAIKEFKEFEFICPGDRMSSYFNLIKARLINKLEEYACNTIYLELKKVIDLAYLLKVEGGKVLYTDETFANPLVIPSLNGVEMVYRCIDVFKGEVDLFNFAMDTRKYQDIVDAWIWQRKVEFAADDGQSVLASASAIVQQPSEKIVVNDKSQKITPEQILSSMEQMIEKFRKIICLKYQICTGKTITPEELVSASAVPRM